MTCTLEHAQKDQDSLLLSIDKQLTCSQLSAGLERYDNEVFYTQNVAFQRVSIPLSVQKTVAITTDYKYRTSADNPTHGTSAHLSKVPSAQPRSSPTTAPILSPPPQSQPSSSSGPTKTVETIKPIQSSTYTPTASPAHTRRPTTAPTAQPSAQTSRNSTTHHSTKPITKPTRAPRCKPSFKPSAAPSVFITQTPSTASTLPAQKVESGLVLTIGGSIIGGLVFLWCIFRLFVWYVQKPNNVAFPLYAAVIPETSVTDTASTDAGKAANHLALTRATQPCRVVKSSFVHIDRNSSGEISCYKSSEDSIFLSSLHSSEFGYYEEEAGNSVFSDEHSYEYSEEEEDSEYSADHYLIPSTTNSLIENSSRSKPDSDSQSPVQCVFSTVSAMEEGSVV